MVTSCLMRSSSSVRFFTARSVVEDSSSSSFFTNSWSWTNRSIAFMNHLFGLGKITVAFDGVKRWAQGSKRLINAPVGRGTGG